MDPQLLEEPLRTLSSEPRRLRSLTHPAPSLGSALIRSPRPTNATCLGILRFDINQPIDLLQAKRKVQSRPFKAACFVEQTAASRRPAATQQTVLSRILPLGASRGRHGHGRRCLRLDRSSTPCHFVPCSGSNPPFPFLISPRSQNYHGLSEVLGQTNKPASVTSTQCMRLGETCQERCPIIGAGIILREGRINRHPAMLSRLLTCQRLRQALFMHTQERPPTATGKAAHKLKCLMLLYLMRPDVLLLAV